MAPKRKSPKKVNKHKTRSRIARNSPNVSPVFDIFPEQAARERARVITGPAGNTRSRSRPAANAGSVAPASAVSGTRGRRGNRGTRGTRGGRGGRAAGSRGATSQTPEPTTGPPTNPTPEEPETPQTDPPVESPPPEAVQTGPAGGIEHTLEITAPNGDQNTTEGAKSQQDGASSTPQGTKRPSSDDNDDDGRDPKTPRIEKGPTGADTGGGQQATQPEAPPPDPCADAAEGLERIRANARASVSLDAVEDPVRLDQQIEDNTVFRAVAAVAEAISELGRGVQFSLLEQTTVQLALSGSAPELATTRPGNDVLLPYVPGGGHTSLYVVRREGTSNSFNIEHFDSADGDWHRGNTNLMYAGNLIRGVLNQTGWDQSGQNTINGGLPTSINMTRQQNNWECGLHTIFSAWAYALGLELADRPQANDERYALFLRDGRALINAALSGFVDSETIRAFLECFEFIQPGQTVPLSRSFDNTVSLQTHVDYQRHNARLRILRNLDLRRADGEAILPLDSILEYLNERGPAVDLMDHTADTLLDTMRTIAASEATVTTGTQHDPASEGGDAGDSPQISPIDTDQEAIQRVLLAEAEAARLRAQTGTPVNTEQDGDATSADNTTTQGPMTEDGPSTNGPGNDDGNSGSIDASPPPPGSDNDDDNGDSSDDSAPPGTGVAAGNFPQQTAAQPSSDLTPSEDPAPDQPSSRSSTPSGISDTMSVDDDDVFTSPVRPTAAPQAVESAELRAFREEEARRMEQASQTEQATQTQADETIEDANQDGQPGTEDASQEQETQGALQEEDADGLFDNDSLFGDEPSPQPSPPAHPPGLLLALPPTPPRLNLFGSAEEVPSSAQPSERQTSPEEETAVDLTFADDDDADDVGGSLHDEDTYMDDSGAIDDVDETVEQRPGTLSDEAQAALRRWQNDDNEVGECVRDPHMHACGGDGEGQERVHPDVQAVLSRWEEENESGGGNTSNLDDEEDQDEHEIGGGYVTP